jgi:RNA polymerase sigma-70 factor (sigma-E family)
VNSNRLEVSATSPPPAPTSDLPHQPTPDLPREPAEVTDALPPATRAQAFDSWARDSGPGLLRFARLVSGNGNDVADVVQDALVAVYARWRRLSPDGAQDGYARRVIVNRSISRWRRVGRREQLVEAPSRVPVLVPDHAVALSDTAAARVLLARLPGRQRAAVMLRFYDDLSFAQIAEILSCRESTARSHVHRALAALRVELESPTEPGEDHD